MRILVINLILLVLLPVFVISASITTDKSIYDLNENVIISGTGFSSSISLAVQVNDPLGEVKFIDQVETDGGGEFSTSHLISSGSIDGEYTAYASGEGVQEQTTFDVQSTSTTTTSSTIQTSSTVPTSTSSTTTTISCDHSCFNLGYSQETCDESLSIPSCANGQCRYEGEQSPDQTECPSYCYCFNQVICNCGTAICDTTDPYCHSAYTSTTGTTTSSTIQTSRTETSISTTSSVNTTSTSSTTSTTVYKLIIDNVEILDTSHSSISSVGLDSQFYIKTEVRNTDAQKKDPMLIIQLKNPNGEVKTSVRSLKSQVNSGGTNYLEASYVASEEGEHTIEAYVWSDWPSAGGTALGSSSLLTFTVT